MRKCIVAIGVFCVSLMGDAASLPRDAMAKISGTNTVTRRNAQSANVTSRARLLDPELSLREFYNATKKMNEDELFMLCNEMRMKYVTAVRLNGAYSACDQYMRLLVLKIAAMKEIDLMVVLDAEVLELASKKDFDEGRSIGFMSDSTATEAQRFSIIKRRASLLALEYGSNALRRSAEKQCLCEQAKAKCEEAKKTSDKRKRDALVKEAEELIEKSEKVPLLPPILSTSSK